MKFLELESLRGLAALLVVLIHIPNFNPILDSVFVTNTYMMVDLFFVLSGFVIYTAYNQKIRSINDLLKFQLLRLGRLYPVHLIFLLMFLLFEVARHFASLNGMNFSNTHAFEKNNLVAFLEHLFLIQTLVGNYQTFNSPSWSISAEFYTYFCFGITILYFNKFRLLIFTVVGLLSVGVLASGLDIYPFHLIFRCLAGFSLGCISGMFYQRYSFKSYRFTSLLIFISLIWFVSTNINKEMNSIIYFISVGLILSLITNPNGSLNKLLLNKNLIWLGSRSYSIYMSHLAILFVTNYLVKFYKPPSFISKEGIQIPALNLLETISYVFIAYSIILILSNVIYEKIEKPYREKSRRLASKYFG